MSFTLMWPVSGMGGVTGAFGRRMVFAAVRHITEVSNPVSGGIPK
jgi:hypothetical protein